MVSLRCWLSMGKIVNSYKPTSSQPQIRGITFKNISLKPIVGRPSHLSLSQLAPAVAQPPITPVIKIPEEAIWVNQSANNKNQTHPAIVKINQSRLSRYAQQLLLAMRLFSVDFLALHGLMRENSQKMAKMMLKV
ncbi:unnamed protein product [Lactuca saligna]|uniref:Uncharacterized protein n=1 Tax=Lactuca saligna TaxID=75948 RepID=A0AA35Z9F1_LACSI|nr:unnamed protein product [Lactuca saligna]